MPPLSIKRPANRKNFQTAKLFSPGRLTLSLRRHAAALIRWRGAPPPAFTANASQAPASARGSPAGKDPTHERDPLTITGNLVDNPELRFTPAGQPVARFRVASTARYKDSASGQWKDGNTLFLTCVAWRQLAEHITESLEKGMRAIVTGRLQQRTYETQEGEKRTVYELQVDDAGPALSRATAKVTKISRSGTATATARPRPTTRPPATGPPSRRSSS